MSEPTSTSLNPTTSGAQEDKIANKKVYKTKIANTSARIEISPFLELLQTKVAIGTHCHVDIGIWDSCY